MSKETIIIWIIPAAVAAASFFKLGSLYVWVHVMTLVIKALAVACMALLLGGVSAFAWSRIRRHRAS